MFPDYQATITLNNGKKYFSYDAPINLFNRQMKGEIIEVYDKYFRLLGINPNEIFKITEFNYKRDV
ncbi:hypothetical protein [Staphylococcus hyicus]|uniref:hypothetical protein n=1 Tax=Staphylococcus hyicus TaxID=1284 RepID=UPI00057E3032|nr:hypothetical protein [Staphylococcus hyicus]AJC95790.1 hypothetical protein SHYC_05160 [Staphylococcus hyicus]RTX65624.1 hypothetical protein EKQ60_11280 [Staphylococcus hyicus]SQE47286.1 Uncharacterised protein [Staphylococcus hyicus]